jgi:hypothetical protein
MGKDLNSSQNLQMSQQQSSELKRQLAIKEQVIINLTSI